MSFFSYIHCHCTNTPRIGLHVWKKNNDNFNFWDIKLKFCAWTWVTSYALRVPKIPNDSVTLAILRNND